MKHHQYTKARIAAGLVATLAALPAVAAEQGLASLVPQRQVVIIVPNAAAGPSDLLARWLSPKLSESLRQNVIVDNKPSANGVTAGEFVARAAPDGSVLGVGNTGTHAINGTLYRKLTYDPVRDFIPVINVFGAGLVLAANPKLDAKSIKDIIALAKAKPGSINVSIAGATGEIATNAIKALAGIDMNNVPYKGGAPAVIAVISGETHFVLTPYGGVNAQVDAGKMKILGTTGARRDPIIPNIPTLAESGLPGFEISMWYGMFAPAKTPAAVINAYNREITHIVNQPEIRNQITSQGFEILTGTPEQFAEVVKRDAEKFKKVILDFKMQQDL
jgi:tripartite-type tricarboxylate transporter receptor subunit TctC